MMGKTHTIKQPEKGLNIHGVQIFIVAFYVLYNRGEKKVLILHTFNTGTTFIKCPVPHAFSMRTALINLSTKKMSKSIKCQSP